MNRRIRPAAALSAVLLLLTMLLSAAGCGTKQASKKSDPPADGDYQVAVTLSGGTGRASVASPTALQIVGGKMTATLTWSSANYDYMLVDGERYEPEIIDGHSVFQIPVAALDRDLEVVADTVAMSTPHEITYTLRFDSVTLEAAK